jgi:hypothetical protein
MKPIDAVAMYRAKRKSGRSCQKSWRAPLLALIAPLVGIASGCNSSIISSGNSNTTENTPDLYLAGGTGALLSYQIDLTAQTFVVESYEFNGLGVQLPQQEWGWSIQDSGSASSDSNGNGILSLAPTYFPDENISSPSQTGIWAVTIPGQAALAEVEATNSSGTSTTFAPLVPTQSCPSLTAATTFQFVTIPKVLNTSSTLTAGGWNPELETAYGSVSVTTNGTAVQFSSVSQHTLPSTNGGVAGAPSNPAPSGGATAVCSPTFFGQTVSVPSSVTITNPSAGGTGSVPASATIGIGPSGFLLEDAGSGAPDPTTNLTYENILGAGYGAIGLSKPSSALSTSSVVAAQYQGILYGAASGASATMNSSGFRMIGSFGYSNLATACPTLPAPSTSTIIYGGEFANNDPSANMYGNCDLAIDLGAQDATNNGLYPAATVYVSSSFPYNGIGSAYSFPALAIAGQISGKYAIFLIGVDTAGSPNQPWGIYLLQSN